MFSYIVVPGRWIFKASWNKLNNTNPVFQRISMMRLAWSDFIIFDINFSMNSAYFSDFKVQNYTYSQCQIIALTDCLR